MTLCINNAAPGKRLVSRSDLCIDQGWFLRQIYSPTGKIHRDYDDVRRFTDAASAGVKKALSLGAKSPLVASFGSEKFPEAHLVTLLGAMETTYVVDKKECDLGQGD